MTNLLLCCKIVFLCSCVSWEHLLTFSLFLLCLSSACCGVSRSLLNLYCSLLLYVILQCSLCKHLRWHGFEYLNIMEVLQCRTFIFTCIYGSAAIYSVHYGWRCKHVWKAVIYAIYFAMAWILEGINSCTFLHKIFEHKLKEISHFTYNVAKENAWITFQNAQITYQCVWPSFPYFSDL